MYYLNHLLYILTQFGCLLFLDSAFANKMKKQSCLPRQVTSVPGQVKANLLIHINKCLEQCMSNPVCLLHIWFLQ